MTTFHANVEEIPLNPRNLPTSAVRAGAPRVAGRVMSLSADRKSGRAIWESTPGTLAIAGNPDVTDVGYVLSGRGAVRVAGEPDLLLEPGVMLEFPGGEYELEIVETLKKISFLYAPKGLKIKAEPF